AKMQVETCAAETQALIDSGKKVIVGVNKYKLAKEDPIEILDIDNHAVREGQITRLAKIRATMCACGAVDIAGFQEKARFVVVSPTSIVEGGAHDVIRKESQMEG
ncbi:MAG TPA: methylmalonyl-CoA mutase family protein, partial [Bacillota bacterium]|nr:methylmalonyl-CoA mutase family protein [Bacillota bacterium]